MRPALHEAADLPIRQSVQVLASALRAEGRLSTPFRARLKAMGFDSRQIQAISAITPGAIVRASAGGIRSRDLAARVDDHGRELAQTNADPASVQKALRAYKSLLAPIFAALPPAQRQPARIAYGRLHLAVCLRVERAWSQVLQHESRLQHRMFKVMRTAQESSVFFTAMLAVIQDHFDASSAVLLMPCREGTKVAAAGGAALESIRTGEVLRRRRTSLVSGHRKCDAPSLKKGFEKCRSICAVSFGTGVLQLGFPDVRRVLPRNVQLLAAAAEQCRFGAERLDREHTIREMSVRMLEIDELERRRISRELHDDAGQSLLVMRLQLEMAEMGLNEQCSQIRESLAEVRQVAERTIISVRKLISDLSPAVLEQLGLAAAVRQRASRFREQSGLRVRLRIGKLPELDGKLKLVIYRVLQECLTNISSHSSAKNVNISLQFSDKQVRLSVEDDGVGFDVEEAVGRPKCYGLLGIRERVTLLGGSLLVSSTCRNASSVADGSHGTCILVSLPASPKL